MKYIAFYLPQFHPVKENDEWWGKGFTEWRNVTKAKPLFEGHYQPQLPGESGFYDLRVPEVMEEQAKLAKEYGIDAFCYYHYWFNGKLLLEKPLQQMLNNKNIDIDFCMCWANENWTRRWDGKEAQVLMGQNYDEYDPKAHMEWLLPYFKDSRYIKIQNKPIFLVYRAMDIPKMKDIIRQWDLVCKEQGFDGIYVIAANTAFNKLTYTELLELGFNAIYNFEPNSFDTEDLSDKGLIKNLIYNYKAFVERSINKQWENKLKVFPTVFPNWDNTARRKEEGIIIQNENINDYTYWLYNSMKKVEHLSTEEQIVFINAWNEWAEGAHLEPDLIYGRLDLEATLYTKNAFEKQEYSYHNFPDEKNSTSNSIFIDINRPILIWGTGLRGKKTYCYLPKQANFIGFIDSDIKKRFQKLENEIIYCWSEDKENLLKKNPIILIASSFENEIVDELIKEGVKEKETYTNKLYLKVIDSNTLEIY